jgi:hypothetical protein
VEQESVIYDNPLKWEKMIYDAGYSFNKFCLMSGFSHSRLKRYCDGESRPNKPSVNRFTKGITKARAENREPHTGRWRQVYGY